MPCEAFVHKVIAVRQCRQAFSCRHYYDSVNYSSVSQLWQQNAPQAKALSRDYTKETLHTMGVQADLKHGWTLGARYKSYVSPFTQRYVSGGIDEALLLPDTCLQQSHQNIDNVKASIDKACHFNPKSSLTIGFTHQYNRSTTEITATGLVTRNRQTENIEALYAQGNFMLFKQLNVMLGARGEYIKSTRRNLQTGERTTLWEEFTLFPSATLGLPVLDIIEEHFSLSWNMKIHYC